MLPASSTSSAAAAALHLWFCRHGPPVVPSTRARRRNLSSYRPPPRDPGDPYRTLGLPRSASRAEVKAAYYSLSKRFHPDLNPGGEEEAAEKFRAVKEAYEAIMGGEADNRRPPPPPPPDYSNQWPRARSQSYARSGAEHEVHRRWREEMSKRHRWRQRQQEQRQEQEQEQSKDAEGPFWWWEEVEKQRRRSGEGPRGFGNFGGGDSHWWDWEEGRWQKRGGKDESKRPYREEWDQDRYRQYQRDRWAEHRRSQRGWRSQEELNRAFYFGFVWIAVWATLGLLLRNPGGGPGPPPVSPGPFPGDPYGEERRRAMEEARRREPMTVEERDQEVENIKRRRRRKEVVEFSDA